MEGDVVVVGIDKRQRDDDDVIVGRYNEDVPCYFQEDPIEFLYAAGRFRDKGKLRPPRLGYPLPSFHEKQIDYDVGPTKSFIAVAHRLLQEWKRGAHEEEGRGAR